MFKISLMMIGLSLSASSFAGRFSSDDFQKTLPEIKQKRLQMNSSIIHSREKTALKDGDLFIVAMCGEPEQSALSGGCEVKGPIVKQDGSATTFSKSDALLQSFATSFSSLYGVETQTCFYKNLKKGDVVTASVNCK